MTEKRTPEGADLRRSLDSLKDSFEAQSQTRDLVVVEITARETGELVGAASWARHGGWTVAADVSKNLKVRGDGRVTVSVVRQW